MVVAKEMAAWRAYADYVGEKLLGRNSGYVFNGDAVSRALHAEWLTAHRERWGLA